MIKHNENGTRAAADDNIRLLDYVAVLLHRWRTIAVCTVLALAAGFAIVKLSPPVYRSSAVLVPSLEQGGGSGLMSELPAFMAARMGGGGGTDRKLVAGILQSRSLRDSVIEKVARGNPRVPRALVEEVVALETRRKVSPTDASITIEVDAPDPRLAQAVADAYPGLINRIATHLTVEAAAAKLAVLERQLAEAGERLARSEERLLAFQRSSGTADVQEQARQGLQTAAALQGQILQKEVQVAELRRSLAPGHPRLRSAEGELSTMRGQLERLTGGGASGIFPGARQVPELQARAADVLREYKTNEQVYLALGGELANALVNVSQDVAVVTVLDAAVLPKVPQQSLTRVLMAALLLGLAVGTILALVREYMARVRRDPENEPFRLALDQFKTDVTGVFRRDRTPAGRG
ncbi:MAG TPA: Wzz/FepE/Etk N-terminal domain-containing protein [Longimicrobium sp.]|nr:Wzz/FepE/Etk N-terminal domain-containing protein [Longimicrobium sp.]